MIQHTTRYFYMVFHMNDYKGKWYVLADEEDDMYGSHGTIEESEIDLTFLEEHASMCSYYGIPMYTGDNEAFKQRCDDVLDTIQTKEEEFHAQQDRQT